MVAKMQLERLMRWRHRERASLMQNATNLVASLAPLTQFPTGGPLIVHLIRHGLCLAPKGDAATSIPKKHSFASTT